MPATLKQKAVSGTIWVALQKSSVMLIQFISEIVLARLLMPYDYGCIGMLIIFITLSNVLIDGGFGAALIQKRQPTKEDYSTIFWWNMGMATIMYTILFFAAPIIAQFYDIPQLSNILRVQGLILFLYAFKLIQQTQLRKKLNFRLLSIVTIAASILALLITIWMAYSGYGVWALVAQYLITAAVPTAILWFTVRWRPVFNFSTKSFKELFGFGVYMFLTQFLNEFCRQIQGLIIGKVYNPNTLGYYSKAERTESVASTSIAQIMIQVTYPVYAEMQDNKNALACAIKRITSTLAYITFPLLFLMMLCAKPIFTLLYTERWLPSVSYFQVLCIAGFAYSLQSVNLQAVAAIGKSKVMLQWTIVKRVVGLSFIVVGLALWQMKGLLCGVVLHNWFAYFVNVGLASKYIGYKWWRQLLHLMPILIVSIIAIVISCGISLLFDFSLYLDGAMKIIVFIIVYVGCSFIFKLESFVYFKDISMSLIKTWRTPRR